VEGLVGGVLEELLVLLTGLAPITNKRKVKPAAQSSRLFLVFVVVVVVDTHQRQRRGRMTGSAGPGSSIVRGG
jgi:hypothetical protein